MILSSAGIQLLNPQLSLRQKVVLQAVDRISASAKDTYLFGPRSYSIFLQRLISRAFGRRKLELVRFTEGPLEGLSFQCWSSEKYFFLGSSFEHELQEMLQDLVRPGAVVYDIGGHLGYMALLFSRYCGRVGSVFTFEPSPHNYERLLANVLRNSVSNITVVNAAVSDVSGLARIEERGSMSEVRPLDGGAGPEIRTVRIDDLVLNGMPLPSFIKLDVEGHAFPALRGMQQVINEARPSIMCELHDAAETEGVEGILRDYAYEILHLDEHVLFPKRIIARPSNVFSLSVVIPTKNRSDDLCNTMQSLLQQRRLPEQVIVIDQSTSKGAPERNAAICGEAGMVANVVYVHDDSLRGLTQARNSSLKLVSADVVLFLDDDITLEPDFTEEILAVYRGRPEVSGVSGVITNYARPSWRVRLWDRLFRRGPFHDPRQEAYWQAGESRLSAPVTVDRLGGGLMSFRRDVLSKVHFDERMEGVCDGEDIDFCMQLGERSRLLIAPRARLKHNQSPAGRLHGHWLHRDVRAAYFLYIKNWRRGVKNRACFAWLNFGFILIATAGSFRRFSLEPWRAYLRGLHDAAQSASRH